MSLTWTWMWLANGLMQLSSAWWFHNITELFILFFFFFNSCLHRKIPTEEPRIPGEELHTGVKHRNKIRTDESRRAWKIDSHNPHQPYPMSGKLSAGIHPSCRRRTMIWADFTMDPRAGPSQQHANSCSPRRLLVESWDITI